MTRSSALTLPKSRSASINVKLSVLMASRRCRSRTPRCRRRWSSSTRSSRSTAGYGAGACSGLGHTAQVHQELEKENSLIQARMKRLQSLNSIIGYFLREHPEVRITSCLVPLTLMPSHRCASPLRRSAPTSMRSSTASRTTASLRCWMYDMNVWDSVEECSISIAVFIVLRLRHQTGA